MCDFVHARNYVLKKNFIHRLRKLNCCRLALPFRPRLTLERYPNCRLFLQSKQSGNCRVRHTVTGCNQQRKQRDVTAWYAMDTGTNLLQRPKSLDGVFPQVHACAVHTQPGDTTHWLACVREEWVGGWVVLVWVQLRILKTCDRRADVADFNSHVFRLHKCFISCSEDVWLIIWSGYRC